MLAALTANVSSPALVYGGVLVDDDGGQSEQGIGARPMVTLQSGTTGTGTGGASVKETMMTKTSGVETLLDDLFLQLRVWGIMLVVFVITL